MQPTKKTFLKDVSEHQMTVKRDEGFYRHLRFRKPNSSDSWFDIVTWPGYLCYSGDMGCYVFARLDDMLVFFRSPRLKINPGYWAEKCEARDRDGITEYSPNTFKERIAEWLDDAEVSAEARRLVGIEVLSRADDGESEARRAVNDFESDGFQFHDFWETNLHDYTYRFIWCCYALTWGIRQYDRESKKGRSRGKNVTKKTSA